MGWVEWGKTYKRTSETNWNFVRTWNKKYPGAKVFCASLADVFDMKVPPEWRDDLWNLIRQTPNLVWQILTKRPENIHDMLPDNWDGGWKNVWLGVSVEDQENADKRIPLLIQVPATVHFVSCEPLLGPVDFSDSIENSSRGRFWLIVGGESGLNHRPMNIEWARDIFNQCQEYEIPFFMKQDSGLRPGLKGNIPDELWIQEFPNG